jgi:hypothetical protein
MTIVLYTIFWGRLADERARTFGWMETPYHSMDMSQGYPWGRLDRSYLSGC